MAELVAEVGAPAVCPDLPGHGSSTEMPIDAVGAISVVRRGLEQCDLPAVVMGYSQGGRVALLTALEYPELVSHLVLVSASPGIEHPAERVQRRSDDEKVAREIELDFDAFLVGWSTMFPGLAERGEEWARADLAMRSANRAEGLAAALRGYGQGSQPSAWERLSDLTMPVTLVVGARDEKYRTIAARMAERIPEAHVAEVEGGHALVGERPAELADIVRQILGT